jgi:hypothetical protein
MKSLEQGTLRVERHQQVSGFLSSKLPDNIATLATELWSAAGRVRGAGLSAALNRVLEWRLEDAAEILDSELQQVKRRLSRVGEVEEAAGMVLRYIRAAEEGTAAINLRIMAKVIRGLASGSRLQSCHFLRYAEAIAPLTAEEIFIISALYEKTVELERQGLTRDRDNQAWAMTTEELVPLMFDDEQSLAEVTLTASRTGLVTKAGPFKLGPFCVTPLLNDLARLASLRRAIIDEGHDY